MELRLAVEGNLRDFLKKEQRAAEGGRTAGLRRAATNLKNDIRRQTVAAGLDRNSRPGRSVSKTWQSQVFPKDAASRVFSKFPRAMIAFETGAVIRAANGKWLAVPANVGTIGNRRVRIKDMGFGSGSPGGGKLQFVPTRNPNVARLVHRSPGKPDVTLFWLFRQVRIKKRISFYAAADKWGDRIPEFVIAEWERRAERAGIA